MTLTPPRRPDLWSWTATEEIAIASLRLDRILATALTGTLSRTQIQRAIEEGRVKINGEVAHSKSVISPGALVTLEGPELLNLADHVIPENRPIPVLFEDEHLLIVNKPPGMTVHPSPTQTEGTLVNALLHQVSDLSGIGGTLRPGIVHRLDKDTSGALVVSKSDRAHLGLTELFARHAIDREYWALCYGVPRDLNGRIESLIGRNPHDRKKMSMKVREGRRAVTHYSVTERYGSYASRLTLRLETGRTHQIRVHLTGLGHSVLGDRTYGTPTENQPKWRLLPETVQQAVREMPGQALHARVLGFVHPITGSKVRVEADAPEPFMNLLAQLSRTPTSRSP